MRRVAKLKFQKKPRKKKKEGISFSEKCDFCGDSLHVCRTRDDAGLGMAQLAGQSAFYHSVKEMVFFCSDGCAREFIVGNP